MTTTSVYQGRELDRNTSRVLAPPGGKSNNIFGTDDSYSASQQQRAPAKPVPPMDAYERAQPSHSIHENNDIFGSGDRNAMHVEEHNHGRGKGIKPTDESALNVMGGSQIGDGRVQGDSKTISADAATAAVQGQRFKAKGQAPTHNPLTWKANKGFEKTKPPACWDDQPATKMFKGRESSHNPITWRPSEDSKDYWYGNKASGYPDQANSHYDQQEQDNRIASASNKQRAQASAYNPVSWSLNPGEVNEPTPEPIRSPRGQGLGPKGTSYNLLTGEEFGAPQEQQRHGKKHHASPQDTRPW